MGVRNRQDSMGTEETLGRGGVQFMTAGTGIRHSEHNVQEDPPFGLGRGGWDPWDARGTLKVGEV